MKLHWFFAVGMAALALGQPAEARRHRHAVPRPLPAVVATANLDEPVSAALKAARAGRRVIAVFDIDNTLLTTPQDLGGDAWFTWRKTAHADGVIGDSTLVLQNTQMDTTQPDVPSLIGDLQAHHVTVYALSARGEALRAATLSALHDNRIALGAAPECGPPLCVKRGLIHDAQIRAAERQTGMMPQAAPYYDITVSDGVMLVSGQDKGVMLRLLLASLRHRYDDVFFVDDTEINVTNVQAAAPGIPARVHPYSYTAFREGNARFAQDSARQAKAEDDLAALKAKLCAAVKSPVCPQP